jgi:hypothetical protein
MNQQAKESRKVTIRVGDVIRSRLRHYRVSGVVRRGWKTAEIYKVIGSDKKKYILKYFHRSVPKCDIGRNKFNHYGRRRDGSELVFDEIQSKCRLHEFLVDHIERLRVGDKWAIVIEFVEGVVLGDFILQNHKNERKRVISAIEALGQALSEWHANEFAHGDPHIFNAILVKRRDSFVVRLFDYSEIHHPDFVYCRKYKCYSVDPFRRIREDLRNPTGRVGMGFVADLERMEGELGLGTMLSDAFQQHYTRPQGSSLRITR